ncbi:hypothetical protein AVEN_244767-1 [Araneus ventricosus]|uniref:Uncharacterized protein n=1 Tax=Araneus ventricosus TaxID=182803 RepID=A0A4Y2BRV8_ARAVE|nr:hypothetical protein AVEN_244767-1 [Araneus ventricosus]
MPMQAKWRNTLNKCFKCLVGLKRVFEMITIHNEYCFQQIPIMTTISNLGIQEHLSIAVVDLDEPHLASKMSNASSNNTAVSATRTSHALSLLETVTSANFSEEMSASLTNSSKKEL